MPSARRWIGRVIYRAPRELTHCPACHSPALSALALHKLPAALDGRRTGLVSGCEDCGLVFVNPSPSDAALATMYGPEGEWALGRLDESIAVKPEAEQTHAGGQWRRMFDPIRADLDVTRPPAGSRALDFGCGRGKFLDVLKPCGWETFGIEPATDAAFARHRRLEVIPETPTFDLVIAHHVLEHVTDPLALLKQFAAATRAGGYLLVAVPRLDTLPVHRDLSYVISRVHVRSYTSVCMEGLLARAGWQIVEAPRDEVTISGGRKTSARLRMLARLASQPGLPMPQHPLESARRALKNYYQHEGARSLIDALARAGSVRAAARATESRRQIRKTLQMLQAILKRARGQGRGGRGRGGL
jgi:SAM-dependent methyltransferase